MFRGISDSHVTSYNTEMPCWTSNDHPNPETKEIYRNSMEFPLHDIVDVKMFFFRLVNSNDASKYSITCHLMLYKANGFMCQGAMLCEGPLPPPLGHTAGADIAARGSSLSSSSSLPQLWTSLVAFACCRAGLTIIVHSPSFPPKGNTSVYIYIYL